MLVRNEFKHTKNTPYINFQILIVLKQAKFFNLLLLSLNIIIAILSNLILDLLNS
jgi:hypothetical protein